MGMLDQVARWTEIAGTVADVLLLLRIVTLRLYRTYQFVTLYCVVVVGLDAAGWMLGLASKESERVFVYSRFLMIVIFPLAAWDCFEVLPESLRVFRRPQLIRLIAGMLLTTMLAMLVGATADSGNPYDVTVEVAIIVWLSAAAASLGFIWIMRRLARVQKLALTANTETLSLFFLLALVLEVLAAASVVMPMRSAAPTIEIGLSLAGAAVSAWCILRLRPESQLTEPSEALKP